VKTGTYTLVTFASLPQQAVCSADVLWSPASAQGIIRSMKKITPEQLEHALLVHEDTMKVVRGEKVEYGYKPEERRKARKIILQCGVGKAEVIQ
jgi:hypothetical protein